MIIIHYLLNDIIVPRIIYCKDKKLSFYADTLILIKFNHMIYVSDAAIVVVVTVVTVIATVTVTVIATVTVTVTVTRNNQSRSLSH